MKLVIDGRRVGFSRRMDQLLAYAEHHGLLMGGGWDTKKAHAEFWPEPHKECARKNCTSPILKRVTKRERDALVVWAKAHALNARWR